MTARQPTQAPQANSNVKKDLLKALDNIKDAGLERSATRNLRHTLRKWLREPIESRQNGLYYALEYTYEDTDVELKKLVGRDLAVGQVLKDLSKELDFKVFIARLEKEEHGETEVDHSKFYDVYREEDEEESEEESFHFLENIIDSNCYVNAVHYMNGKPFVDGGLSFDPYEDILQGQDYQDVFEGVEAVEEFHPEDHNGIQVSTFLPFRSRSQRI